MHAITISLALLCGFVAGHADNTIYQSLITEGLTTGGEARHTLPVFTMPDGLSAAEQTEVIKTLPEQRYDLAELIAASPNAPFHFLLKDIQAGENQVLRSVDMWFVARGKLSTVSDREFAIQLFSSRDDTTGHSFTAEELAKRGITLTSDQQEVEGYGYGVAPLLDRVQIRATSHSLLTRTEESVLVAGMVEPKFTQDAEFPNQWQSLSIRDGAPTGDSFPYDGTGFYTKITQLKEPADSLFIESHMVFVEPHGWFDGKAILRSKLPILLRTEVRGFRTRLARGPQAAAEDSGE